MRRLGTRVDFSYPFPCDLAFLPDGRGLVGVAGCCLFLWDLAAGDDVPAWVDEPGGLLFRLALSPCGRYAAGVDDRCLLAWDLAARTSGKLLWPGGNQHLADAAFTPDGRELLTVLTEGGGVARRRVGSWRKKSGFGRWPGRLAGRPAFFSGHLAFSPDRTTLATSHRQAGRRGRYGIKLWHFPEGTHRRTAVCGPDSIDQLAFSPDGRLLAVQHEYCRLCLYDAATLALRAEHVPEPPAGRDADPLRRVAFHPGGRLLAATGGTTVTLLAVDGLRPVQAYDWGIGRTFGVGFSLDGLRAAVSGEGSRVVVWDVD